MPIPTSKPASRQGDVKTEPLLRKLLSIEKDVKDIFYTRGVEAYYPNACDDLRDILTSINRAYIRFNEGDDKK